jgi:hypothetical protein
MFNSKKGKCLILVIFLFALLLSACAGFQGVTKPPEGKYLFVQKWVKREATGWGFSWGPDRIHYYIFDPVLRLLQTKTHIIYLDFKPTTWGLIGDGHSSQGDAGREYGSGVVLMQAFPYKTEIEVFTGKVEKSSESMTSIPVELLAVSADGVLLVEIDGRRMVLAPNESWSRVVEADVANEVSNGHLIITSSVINYGWIDISNIKYNQ